MTQVVSANQFNLVPEISRLGTGFAQGQQIGQQFRQKKREEVQDTQEQSEKRRAGINRLANDLIKIPYENRPAALEQAADTLIGLGIDPSVFNGQDPNDKSLTEIITGTGGFEASKPVSSTTLEKNLIAAGFKPGTQEFQAEVQKSLNKPIGTTVNIGGDQVFSKEVAKGYAGTLSKVNEQRDVAIEANQSLDVLENIDVKTGALEPAKQGIASFARAFGIDSSALAKVSAGEAFNAEAQRIVLSVKASQKGPQTDKDEATIRKTVANLGNTREGNQFIIDSARALNNRRIERADFYDKFIQDNDGKFKTEAGQTANSAWAKFKRETPMISANKRTPEGLPVFFYKFEDEVRKHNPDASKAEILEAWRDFDKKRAK